MNDDKMMSEEQWRAIIEIYKEAGRKIDPETAEVFWSYGPIENPYYLENYPIPNEHCTIGRLYWARSPGSEVWVEFGDLPDATRHALYEKHKHKLDFPAGVPCWGSKEDGLSINPETAEVAWTSTLLDFEPDLPRRYFARSPETGVWVPFSDLPESTSAALWEKHRGILEFPAGPVKSGS